MTNNLPSGYTELEYIETNGNTYINTGFTPDSNTSIEMKVSFQNVSSSTYCLYCARNKTSGTGLITYTAFKYSPNKLRHDYNSTIQEVPSLRFEQDVDYIIKSKKNEMYVDGELVHTITYNEFTAPCNMILFASMSSANSIGNTNWFKGKIYYCKIWDGEEVVRLFIPCTKDSTHEVGLYDVINDSFYSNLKTGGIFIAGPIATDEPEIKESIEIDWSASMEQTFEYYEVDPHSWKDKRRLNTVKKSSIRRDLSSDTLGSATIDVDDLLGECYIRIYLIIRQNGGMFKITLGTFIVQTPSSSYDGKVRSVSMDAYTPLLELKENPLPLGYALMKDDNIMHEAYMLTKDNCRARVVETSSDKLLQDNFVADPSEKWLDYISALIDQAKYRLDVDPEGVIMFAPKQKTEALQPIWTFNDDNSSILSPQITMQHDLYGIPNVVEVTAYTGERQYTARIVNDDPNSPTSTINRGREILYREDDPNLPGYPTEEAIDEYAKTLLESLSSVEYQVSYTHGYCPVRIGDAIRLNYKRAGLENIKAKVISQTINCEKGCQVSETAVFTKKLWN